MLLTTDRARTLAICDGFIVTKSGGLPRTAEST
jgi:hypothetical protein